MSLNTDDYFAILKILIEVVALLASVYVAYTVSIVLAILWIIIIGVTYINVIFAALNDIEEE